VLTAPSVALAAGHQPLQLPAWSVVPFVLLLLCIAVLPLAAGRFWHSDRNKAVVVLLLAVPVILYFVYLELATGQHALGPLVHELGKYASFIIMLGSLYTVAGGIVVRGDLRPTPLTNAAILGVGALLANLIGTTGASVLLIRPFLRINGGRKNTAHLPVFFIFLVGNLGGCLTPLGDPPLFMGYLHGVPFTWTLGLWPEYLCATGLVLAAFVVWDSLALRGEAPGPAPAAQAPEPVRLAGKINFLLLAGIIGSLLVESRWFPQAVGRLWELFGSELVMLAMAGLSLRFTPAGLRAANGFTWAPITEVAILLSVFFLSFVQSLLLM
jgi:Na+/H+ antiporter NhaD/arsenite permease-like protein